MKNYGLHLAEGASITNLVVPTGDEFPDSPDIGELFFKTTDDSGLFVYKDTWVLLSRTAPLVKYAVAFTNSNSQWSVEISDFDKVDFVSAVAIIDPSSVQGHHIASVSSYTNTRVCGSVIRPAAGFVMNPETGEITLNGSSMMFSGDGIMVLVKIEGT